MPVFSSITLNDGSSDKTYNPTKIDQNEVAIFKDQSAGIPVGYPSMSVQVTLPSSSNTNGVARVKVQMALPKLDTITPSGGTVSTQTVINTARAHVEFILPVQSALADRTKLLTLLSNALANENIQACVKNLESFY